MRIILLIFLFFGISFAQYSQNEVSNSTFDNSTGWALSGLASIGSGVLTITGNAGTGNIATYTLSTGYTADVDTFKITYQVTANTISPDPNLDCIYSQGALYYLPTGYYWPDSKLDVGIMKGIMFAKTTNNILRLRSNSAWTSGAISIDNLYFYREIDTLWVFTTGSDADNDTVQTVSQALETRGINTSNHGNFIFEGIFDESITLDSNTGTVFGKMEGTSNTATITSIDFSSLTGTVDLANLTITTKLNDSNITYLNGESILQYPEWKGWPDWEQ